MAVRQNSLPPLPVQDGVEFRLLPFDERYCVSDDGRVFSCRQVGRGKALADSWRELTKKAKPTTGHLHVTTGSKNRSIHRLVLMVFDRMPRDGEECRHLDGNPKNNCLWNLAWGTPKENQADRIRHDTHDQGERSALAKFTNHQAAVIHSLRCRHPGRTGIGKFLAGWFGVSQKAISDIYLGERYACATRPGVVAQNQSLPAPIR